MFAIFIEIALKYFGYLGDEDEEGFHKLRYRGSLRSYKLG